MKGSVRKRYNNAWSYRIDLGFVDGKRKQVEKGGFKTEREGKATRAYATLKRYDSLYRNHIKDEFGPLYVYQISATMIIDFLNQKRLKYSRGGKIPLSANRRWQKQRHRLGLPLGNTHPRDRAGKPQHGDRSSLRAGLLRLCGLGFQQFTRLRHRTRRRRSQPA